MERQRRDRTQRAHGSKTLGVVALVAAACCILLYERRTLTGNAFLDGGIGVITGLYTCSLPAANAVDFLYASRGGLRHVASELSGAGWLALNVLVMLVGWLAIVSGAVRFVG